jgi:hypothetical protein
MADPIIIDDGGSVRIRHTRGFSLDNLLDGSVAFNDPTGFSELRVEAHAPDGTNNYYTTTNPASSPSSTNATTGLSVNDVYVIRSMSGHVVTVKIISGTSLSVNLKANDPASGTHSQATLTARSEASSHFRTYDIINADRISTVTYYPSYPATAGSITIFDVAVAPSAFTLVDFS